MSRGYSCWEGCVWKLVNVPFGSKYEIEAVGRWRVENEVWNRHLWVLPDWTRKIRYDLQAALRTLLGFVVMRWKWDQSACFSLAWINCLVNYLKCLIFFMLDIMHWGYKKWLRNSTCPEELIVYWIWRTCEKTKNSVVTISIVVVQSVFMADLTLTET